MPRLHCPVSNRYSFPPNFQSQYIYSISPSKRWPIDDFRVYEPIIYKDSFSALETLLRTLSRDFIEGKNNYPYTHPMIYPNYQSHPFDVKILVEAFNISQKLSQTKTLKDIGVQE
uniref:Uncharacterized protein n=1 Tax=Timema genevievae TaxID=629358 RepID=A0A7R9PIU5_TIMGE|nr:unnamed protein product [Timema genevievae]